MNHFITVLAWNVYIGNLPGKVRAQLAKWIDDHSPHVIILMEATRMYGHLDGLGYRVIQFRPRRMRPGNQPATANIAIMVRRDLRILRTAALWMTVFWLGPKHGWPQDPRVYRFVKVRRGGLLRGKTWRLGGAHTPFGKEARVESRVRLVRWLGRIRKGGVPTVLCLDANMNLHDFRKDIATPGDALASGDGIDLCAFKNCFLVWERNLGHGPSDHPAMLRRFRA